MELKREKKENVEEKGGWSDKNVIISWQSRKRERGKNKTLCVRKQKIATPKKRKRDVPGEYISSKKDTRGKEKTPPNNYVR